MLTDVPFRLLTLMTPVLAPVVELSTSELRFRPRVTVKCDGGVQYQFSDPLTKLRLLDSESLLSVV